jgi:hypothetical protein
MEKKRSLGKKLVIAAAALVLLLTVAAAAGIIYLNHYLNTEGFRDRLEGKIRARAGVEVKVGDLSASIFKGFTVRKVAVASPAAGDPPLFTVAELVLKYRLADLLSRKVTVDRIVVASPRVRLRKDSAGKWILPTKPATKEKPPSGGPAKKKEPETAGEVYGWKIAVNSFRVEDGSAELFAGESYDPVRIEELDLSGRLLRAGEISEIEARIEIEGIDLGGDRLVSGLESDLSLKGTESLTADLKAVVAGGSVSGNLAADLKDKEAIPYRIALQLEEVDLARLLRTFAPGSGMEVTGGIFGRIEARGEAGDSESTKASGDLEIRQGSITGNRVQGLIAALLQDEHLRTIRFEQAEADFTLFGRLATLERLIVHSHKTIFTAAGTVDLARGSEMELAVGINFHDDLVDDIKVRELRDSFQPAGDFPGYQVFGFRVWGTPENLKNDFAQRLIKKGAVSRLKEELLKKDRSREEDPGLSAEEKSRKQEKREKKEAAIEEGVEKIFKLFGD